MTTAFQIPRVLQEYCDGRAELQLPGTTIRELLRELQQAYPALYQCICTEIGSVRRHLNLFVNNDFLNDRDGLETRLHPGDVVSVYQAVSGG